MESFDMCSHEIPFRCIQTLINKTHELEILMRTYKGSFLEKLNKTLVNQHLHRTFINQYYKNSLFRWLAKEHLGQSSWVIGMPKHTCTSQEHEILSTQWNRGKVLTQVLNKFFCWIISLKIGFEASCVEVYRSDITINICFSDLLWKNNNNVHYL